MDFGKHSCQTNVTPNPNNYCGGFALCAILNDYRKDSNIGPTEVYKNIQKFQAGALPDALQSIVEKMKRNDTAVCLPSSLVRAAQEKRFSVTLAYCTERLDSFFQAAIPFETERCGSDTEVKEDLSPDVLYALFKEGQNSYFLVLVHNRHWIAVKREQQENFSIYDPETGEEAPAKNTDGLWQYLEDAYNQTVSLVIALDASSAKVPETAGE